MEMKNMFGSMMDCGPIKGLKMSHLGIALKNAAGQMVSYDRTKDEIVNVELVDFNANDMIWAMPQPIKDIKKGDVIRHINGQPVFVTSMDGGIHVVDVAMGEKKEILPTKSMFGFDYVTKIVSLIDFGAMNASEDMPFGNMLPFMMINNCGKNMNPFAMMMLMGNGSASFGQMDMNNPTAMAMLAMCMNGGSEGKDFFPIMYLTSQLTKTQEKSEKPAAK